MESATDNTASAATGSIGAAVTSSVALPTMHLQLGRRAYNACQEANLKTIADVEATWEAGLLSAATIGLGTENELRTALNDLKVCQQPDGNIDWGRYWAAHPIVDYALAISTPALDRLKDEERARDLGSLHLKKACSGLEGAGIGTVGALVDAVRVGLGKLKNFGVAAREETVSALVALSDSVWSDGVVDWCTYAGRRNFPLLPKEEFGEISGATAVELLPTICEQVVPSQLDERAWEIFRRRLLAPKEKRATLEDLGLAFNLTRERVRQIERLSLEAIRKPLLAGDYRGLRFRLRPELRKIFTQGSEHFSATGLWAWTESRWFEELGRLWQVEGVQLEHFDRLLIELFCYVRVRPKRASVAPLVVRADMPTAQAKRLAGVMDVLCEVLAENNLGLDAVETAIALRKRGAVFDGVDEVPTLIELCSAAERVGEQLYRLKFRYLRGRPEQAYRVLAEHGAPLHREELLRRINVQLTEGRRLESEENLVNQLSGDARVQPIGRSGEWALTEWQMETRTLVDLIEDTLVAADEPLPRGEIAARVLAQRPGSEASIAILLETNRDRFTKVGPQLYGLSKWPAPSGEEQWWTYDTVGEFVEEFFAERVEPTVDFSELREAFSSRTGISEHSARGILAFHPAVEVGRPDSRRRTARLRKNWQTQQREPRERASRPLQVDRILAAARARLLQTATGERQLIEVVQAVEKELGVQRPNIYAAISQSEEIETIAVEGSAFKICRLRGHAAASYPQVPSIHDALWRAECERATSRLTLNDVDIGLFMLGRQFDQGMRLLLEVARDTGMPVSSDDLKSIGKRIEWAVRHRVFHDAPTLNLLRTERNARGHEPAPIEERKAILKFEPFLASLYLDYLMMIEQRIEAFRGAPNSTSTTA